MTTWEDQLRDGLVSLKGGGTLQELAEQTGVGVSALSRILNRDRGIGGDVLEQLRQSQPHLVARVFRPANSPGSETDLVSEGTP